MNTAIIFIIIVLGSLLIIGIVLWMLNRSWGDFPRRAGVQPDREASAHSTSPAPVATPTFQEDDATDEIEQGTESQMDNRILITHPMIRRAAESVLYQNSPQARYLVREGDQLFFAVDRIADPQQRAQAVDLMNRFQAGQHVDLSTVMRLLALLDMG